jgi:uncharacterized protein (TIGR01777 family)
MRVIITGGTGMIGRALAGALAPAGYEVILLSRQPERAGALPAGVRAVGWDARSAAGWGHLAEGAAAIVNLAGESIGEGRWTAERKRRIVESRVNAGRAVVEAVAAAQVKPGVVIQASGIGYYGDGGERELDEGAPAGKDWAARLAAELWEPATAPVEALGVRRVIARQGVVLTPSAYVLRMLVLPHRFFVGGPLGSGRQYFAWTHIADEVGALRFLIETPAARGVFNLCAPGSLTNRELERTLGRILGRPVWAPAPAFALRLALGEQADVLLLGQRGAPRRLLELGYRFQFAEAESALRDLLKR